MFNIDPMQWAFNFFTSVTLSEDKKSLVCNKPEHEYDLISAMTSLKYMLQDNGISRIPPGCKLPHLHYRNPDIFDDLKDSVYEIIDFIDGEQYIEVYIRYDSSNGYMVGYEALNKNAVAKEFKRASNERSYFELKPEGRIYTAATEWMNRIGGRVEAARIHYERHKAAVEELLKSLT